MWELVITICLTINGTFTCETQAFDYDMTFEDCIEISLKTEMTGAIYGIGCNLQEAK